MFYGHKILKIKGTTTLQPELTQPSKPTYVWTQICRRYC